MKNQQYSSYDNVDRLIGNIYDTIDDQSAWNDVLKSIDKITGSSCSALLSMRRFQKKIFGYNLITEGYANRFLYYQANLMSKDNIAPLVRSTEYGKVVSSVDLFGGRGVKKSTVYRDFYAECGFMHFMGTNLFVSDDAWVSLVSFRGPHVYPHGAADKRLFQRIAPHVLRSIKISQTINCKRNETSAALDIIEKLQHAAFLLDRHHRVMNMNGLARSLVDKGKVKIDDCGALEIFPHKEKMRSEIENCEIEGGIPLIKLECMNLRIVVFNLFDRNQQLFPSLASEASELILILDVEERLATIVREVRNKFSLTTAEARVFEAALKHSSSYDIADALGLSRETVRSHMKHIFLKMDISSHVELLQYIALYQTAEVK